METETKTKKVGSIVLASDQGLGYLAKAFYDNGIIHKVHIREHSSRASHREWYKPEDIVSLLDLLECDVLLFFENAFDWNIIPKARKRGIKIVLMPMYECTPNPLPYEPDLVLCPSLLDLKYYRDKNSVFIPVPVDVKWKLREKSRVFVHNAGNGGLGGRNGTREVLEAMQYVKSPIKLIIRSQMPIETIDDPRIDYRIGQFPIENLWDEGDVFIFPEKFNGLSLPLQEAHASGMLVMAGNRYPMNTWLPEEPLIPVASYSKQRITATQFLSASYDPQQIAREIDAWYDKDITEYSNMGREFNKNNSWKKLREKYINLLFA